LGRTGFISALCRASVVKAFGPQKYRRPAFPGRHNIFWFEQIEQMALSRENVSVVRTDGGADVLGLIDRPRLLRLALQFSVLEMSALPGVPSADTIYRALASDAAFEREFAKANQVHKQALRAELADLLRRGRTADLSRIFVALCKLRQQTGAMAGESMTPYDLSLLSDEELSQLVYGETMRGRTGVVAARELYDLDPRVDPFQLASRHRHPAYLAKQRRLKQHLEALKACGNGTCQALEE